MNKIPYLIALLLLVAGSVSAQTHTITASAGVNGSITPSGAVLVTQGDSAVFNISPNTGFHITDVYVDTVSVGAVSGYTFRNVSSNHSISASFAINTYSLTINTIGSGSVAKVPDQTSYNHGSSVILTATAGTGYTFTGWSGGMSGIENPDTITMDGNKTVTATFTLNTYTITASAGANGSIAPLGNVTISHGNDTSFTITPSTGYHIDSVIVDGSYVGTGSSYTFTNVTANQTIRAVYAINQYAITASSGANGTISPSGSVVVNHGQNQTFTFTPSTGYHVDSVIVDGSYAGNGSSHTFTNVTATHTIRVVYAINQYTITASTGANGTISPSGSVVLNHGQNQTFTFTPSTGYHLDSLIVDGVSQSLSGSYTFTNVVVAHTIRSVFAINQYSIIATSGANGSISPSGTVLVNHGANQNFTFTPNTGYHVDSVIVDGVFAGSGSSYLFTIVTVGHTIRVVFAINQYAITASSGANGTITPVGSVIVNHGGNQSFTFTPSTGYHVDSLIVDGVSQALAGSYTFTNVTVGHTIRVAFAINQYTITAAAGSGGSISPTGSVLINHGGSQTFNIAPTTGYHIDSVLVDGVNQGAITSYAFSNVTSNRTISAFFSINVYTVTASAGANGSIAPSGAVAVNHGASQSLTITPITGYHVLDVSVDGSSVGAVGSYTFTNVTAGHTITASFAINTYTLVASGVNGSVAKSPDQATYNHGTSVQLTATPSTGYNFVSWTGDASGSSNPLSVTMDGNKNITATFAINTYSLTLGGANGSITKNPNQTLYNHGTIVSLTPVPATGYHFTSWSGDATGSTIPASVTMDGPKSVTANFILDTLSISASAGANGSITPSGAVAVPYGSNRTFTITPNANYHIDSVVVDGTNQGTAGSFTFTNVTANHTISAFFSINTYPITATVSAGSGTISPSGSVFIPHGGNQSFTMTSAVGYHIQDVVIDGISVGVIPTYFFTNVTSSHTISVTFAINVYTVTASSGTNGSITPQGAQSVNHGDSIAFTMSPSVGYHVADVLVNGSSIGAVTSRTLTNVTSNQTISVTFAINTYTITSTAGSNGTISPSGSVGVNYGGNQSFTITPNTGYHIDSLIVDGASQPVAGSYTFSGVTANHTIRALFAIDQFTITSSAGVNGSINPSGISIVNYGQNQSFTITPAVGYHVDSVIVDGVRVDSISSYTFINVTASHTIRTVYAINLYSLTIPVVGSGTISRTPNQSSYSHGSIVQLNAAPSPTYSFLGWGGDASGSTNPLNVTMDGNKNITAFFAQNTHTITASAGANGAIIPSGTINVVEGVDTSFAFSPGTGYHVDSVFVDAAYIGAPASYTFTNVTSNHTLSVKFAINIYTITATAGVGGTIAPAGAIGVTHGASQAFSITPTTGYHIDSVVVDGVNQGAVGSYSFIGVTSNRSITAYFSINVSTISATSGANGSITPSGAVGVNYGSSQTFTVTPATGYHVDSVIVDGVIQPAAGSYTFSNVTANHTIRVTFAINQYTIVSSASSGGSISPSGSTVVDYGASRQFTATSSVGYHIDSIRVDGVRVDSTTSFTFVNLTSGHTIDAFFSINSYTLNTTNVGSGTITAAPNQAGYDHGTSVVLTATAGVGYTFTGWSGDLSGSQNPVSITMDGNKNITANFTLNTYTISAAAGANGSIAPSGNVTVNHGSDTTFTITPAVGYHIDSVIVDGSFVGSGSSYTFTNVTGNRTISASFAINQYLLTATSGANGSIAPTGAVNVNYGQNQTFSFTPTTGYHVDSVIVDGVSQPVAASYTFSNVTANHTVHVTFAIDQLTITATAGANGTISPSGLVGVSYGDSRTFTFTPSTGYHVDSVIVDGSYIGNGSSYTFTNVIANRTILVKFAINQYTLTASSGANGSITPSGIITVNHGSNASFTITPNVGYYVADLIVDGTSVGGMSSYTFSNVTANHTISASFALSAYTITATAGVGGSISPSGSVGVLYGSSQSFTITPNTGYRIVDVSVDGFSIGAASSYNFAGITANHTISATFGLNTYAMNVSTIGSGSVSKNPNQVSYNHGTDVILSATPGSGYTFAGWFGDLSGSQNPDTVTMDGNKTITATFTLNSYTITATAGPNGSISPQGIIPISHGSTTTFTITPAPGYHIDSLIVDGVSQAVASSYTFIIVTANHTINAKFAINRYTITATAGANGSISPSGAVSVDHGSNQNFTFTPATGYHVADVLVNGASVGPLTAYTFTGVTTNQTISATFAINQYAITAVAGANGSITPSGTVNVNHGSNQAFTFTANTGYHVDSLVVDGVNQPAAAGYTFINVTGSHTIRVTFEVEQFIIAASAGANGSISPSGNVSVSFGTNQIFTFTPAVGFHVDSVIVDGANQPSGSSYQFSNVMVNHTIRVTFAINRYTITASAGARGTISPSGVVSIVHGGSQTFTFTPSVGYHVDSIRVNGISRPPAPSYTFTNVVFNQTISVTFAVDRFAILAAAGPNGSISPSGTVLVAYGANRLFAMTPAAGYHVADVLVDGVSVGAVTSYTFTSVTAPHTIGVSFAVNRYTLNVSGTGLGTISKTPDQATYIHGTTVEIFAASGLGHTFSGWFGDASGSTNPQTIVMDGNKNITARFSADSLYEKLYRTFAAESLAVETDQFGKVGKFIKPIPDKVQVKLRFKAPPGRVPVASGFTIKLSMPFTGYVYADTAKLLPIDSLLNATEKTIIVPVDSGHVYQLDGFGSKGKPISTQIVWHTSPGLTRINYRSPSSYLLNVPRLPVPNRINGLLETFNFGGFAGTKGLIVGKEKSDSSRVYGWLKSAKYTDILRTLYIPKLKKMHTGTPRGLDSWITTEPLLRRQNSLPPDQHNNRLLAEMIAAKINITASRMQILPLGLGELVFDGGSSNPLSGMTFGEIVDFGDSLIMGYQHFAHLFAPQSEFRNLDSTLRLINTAFEGPLDTISFAGQVVFNGLRKLSDVPFLRAGSRIPATITPRYLPELAPATGFTLYQNYPNPFNPTTKLGFNIPADGRVSVIIYNAVGQEVATLLDHEELSEGDQEVTFNAAELASGMYFYRVIAELNSTTEERVGRTFTQVKKMLLVK